MASRGRRGGTAAGRARRARSFVVAYDVRDDRRRTRVAQALADYGQRVGLSVFHVSLTLDERDSLLARLESMIDVASDRVHLFRLCGQCRQASRFAGQAWRERGDPVEVV